MKKLALTLISLMLLIFATPLWAEEIFESPLPITVHVDGDFLPSDVEPRIESGRTLIPFRAAAEAVGAKVNWDAATKKATLSKGNTTLIFGLGDDFFTRNGESIKLDTNLKLYNNRLLLPLRALSQALDLPVKWDNTYRAVSIGKPLVIDADSKNTKTEQLLTVLTIKFYAKNQDNLSGIWCQIDDDHQMDTIYYIHKQKSSGYLIYELTIDNLNEDASAYFNLQNGTANLKENTLTFNRDSDTLYYYGPHHAPMPPIIHIYKLDPSEMTLKLTGGHYPYYDESYTVDPNAYPPFYKLN